MQLYAFARDNARARVFLSRRTSRRRLFQDLVNINVHFHVRFLLNFCPNCLRSFEASFTHLAGIVLLDVGIEWAFVAVLHHEEAEKATL
jgi:hypothetical protein